MDEFRKIIDELQAKSDFAQEKAQKCWNQGRITEYQYEIGKCVGYSNSITLLKKHLIMNNTN